MKANLKTVVYTLVFSTLLLSMTSCTSMLSLVGANLLSGGHGTYEVDEKGNPYIELDTKVRSKKKASRHKRDALKKKGKCPDCEGVGMIGRNICPFCNGTGRWDF